MLLHITRTDRLVLIREEGILSPAEVRARGRAEVFGSADSRRDVVQLLDLQGADPATIVENVRALVDPLLAERRIRSEDELSVLEVNPSLRDSPAFVTPERVRQFCQPDGPHGPSLRFVPWFEAWHETPVPPNALVSVRELPDFLDGVAPRRRRR